MYVYYIPRGGLNDILCRIDDMIKYCKHYNRILLLDTVQSCYKINFSDYFDIYEKNIIYNIEQIRTICMNSKHTVYPQELNAKLMDIANGHCTFAFSAQNYICENIILTLPNNVIHETVIVYTSCGGGHNGFRLFKTLLLKPVLKNYCREKYALLKKPYLCIQVRNTDYTCNYTELYNLHKDKLVRYPTIYVATDDKKVLEFFVARGLPVVNFTTFQQETDINLHESAIDPDTKIRDLFCDIYIMTMCNELLSNSKGGFIQFVRECMSTKTITKRMFANILPGMIRDERTASCYIRGWR